MNTSKIHQDFKGYSGYPLSEGEKLIRDRLIACLDALGGKNELCLSKALSSGREKLLSEIETLKKRLERIRDEMKRAAGGVQYKFEVISAADETRARDIDSRIEDILFQCAGIFEVLTCSETDTHILDRYTLISENLREIERLFHERLKIFKKMQVYG